MDGRSEELILRFNIEDTHLTEMDRVEKLFALVLIAFTWAYKIGIKLNDLIPIITKKHGRKAYSLFKYGINSLAITFNNNDLQTIFELTEFSSCT